MGGGYSVPANRMVLSGDPFFGEAHVHELVHQILAPLLTERRIHGIVNEGLATRAGGSNRMTFPEVLATYADFLHDNPDVTLDLVLEWSSGPDIGSRPAGAVLVLLVEEGAGLEGVRQLFQSGPSNAELRAAVVRILGVSWEEVEALWRNRIPGAGEPPAQAACAR